jgi:ABC-type sugar transport system permease subunit
MSHRQDNTGSTYSVDNPNTSAFAIDDQIQSNRAQVDDLTNVMRQNINMALDRDIQLNKLDRHIENLEMSAGEFRTTTVNTKKKYWWKNVKWTIILITVIVLILVIIIIAIAASANHSKNEING